MSPSVCAVDVVRLVNWESVGRGMVCRDMVGRDMVGRDVLDRDMVDRDVLDRDGVGWVLVEGGGVGRLLVMVEGSLPANAHCQFWFSGSIEPVVAKVQMICVAILICCCFCYRQYCVPPIVITFPN